jgi:hypothetical protein
VLHFKADVSVECLLKVIKRLVQVWYSQPISLMNRFSLHLPEHLTWLMGHSLELSQHNQMRHVRMKDNSHLYGLVNWLNQPSCFCVVMIVNCESWLCRQLSLFIALLYRKLVPLGLEAIVSRRSAPCSFLVPYNFAVSVSGLIEPPTESLYLGANVSVACNCPNTRR